MSEQQDEVARSAKRTERTLEQAIASVQTPEQADKVIDDLHRAAGDVEAHDVAVQEPEPPSAPAAASAIQEAAATTPEKQPQAVIAETAKQIAAAEDEDEEAISQGAQQAVNPEATAVKSPETEEGRRLLQQALLRRMSPLNAADTAVFLAINQRAPRTPLTNSLMHALTTIMNRGDGWVIGLLFATLQNPKRGRRALIDVLPALWLSTATVELPIKSVFRRKRPFIDLVRAIVIGKKPGGYSFPSGHSAAAFGGALLLSTHYPRWRPLFYAIATLVGFSRIYLGAHYPGDVLIGAGTGSILAVAYRWLVRQVIEQLD